MTRNPSRLTKRPYDVLIIGGGIYGVCIAWDAILRGLSVALVERGDFGHATSANSLRIIHGGLRYLQHGDIRRLRRSTYERTVFMRIAPHLVHPLPILIPTYRHLMRGRAIFSLALLANQLITFDKYAWGTLQQQLPRGGIISRAECLRRLPGVEDRGLTGGVVVYDCQMSSSERLVLAFVRSAARAGADLANYVEVTELLREGDRIGGVKAREVLTGDELVIRAKVVVNASGPWSDWILHLLNGPVPRRRLTLSKAFNLLISPQLIREYAVGVYSQRHFKARGIILNKGTRLLFITPWQNRSLIGTAHLPYAGEPDNFRVTEEEMQALLEEVNKAYPGAGLNLENICHAYAGLLPANAHGTDDVQLAKRYHLYDHTQQDGLDGLISVVGVKLTEARYVAEKAVDLAFSKLDRTPPPSSTASTPLDGGHIGKLETFVAQEVRRRSGELSAEVVQGLIAAYGSAYGEVLQYRDDDADVRQPITEMSSLSKAEILHAIREEMAVKLADVIFRRTSLGMAESPGYLDLEGCGAIMAQELGWSAAKVQSEVEETRAVLIRSLQSL
jgi:glycerol-3-phosphate dehydrogenase